MTCQINEFLKNNCVKSFEEMSNNEFLFSIGLGEDNNSDNLTRELTQEEKNNNASYWDSISE